MRVMNVPNPRNHEMNTAVVTKHQKALQTWVKLRAKRAAAVATRPVKHGKKSSA